MSSFVFLSAAITAVLLSRISPGYLYFLAAFPGILAHELAHYVTALTTGANPDPINLSPKREGNRWVMGSVAFQPGWLSAGFVALAPLYMLPFSILLVYWLTSTASPGAQLIGGYVAGCLFMGAWPSRADWEIAARYPAGAVIVLGVLLGIANYGYELLK